MLRSAASALGRTIIPAYQASPAAFLGAQRSFASAAAAEDEFKPPLKLFGLAARYASALYTAAGKAGTLAAVEKELKTVVDAAASDAKFRQFLEDPTMPKAKKLAGLNDFCDGAKMSDTTKSFLKVVAENGRLSDVAKMYDSFEEQIMASKGEAKAIVTTADALTPQELASVTEALKGHIPKGQTLKVEAKVDPRIVGGLTVGIGEKYLDLSLLSRIKKVEAELAKPF